MENELTDSERCFLTSQGLGPDDVMDVRGIPQRLWFQWIEKEGKTVALGSRCNAAGHRLRSRRGHCLQCDTSKLGYQAHYAEERYVYIAGSRSARFIKIGNCRDTAQRERQMCSERYGGVGDWDFVYSVRVKRQEQLIVVAFRKHTLLPLDDCLYALQATIPHLTRSSLHRCLQRHGISRLPDVEDGKARKRKFKTYPIGYFHIDIAAPRRDGSIQKEFHSFHF
jgi:hypothetical protein